ncbi:sugar phosphate isomerase/epimerase family protein [Dactylosporangium sp. CA-233914]|uniref:sugar phosphate isomerase/epimerase family protein n=1 Tax=Dactylosporangium sp. CA-233914 TaxID=3239934 RepID=UPI003D9120A3
MIERAATAGPQLGTTLYSITRDFHGRRIGFDDAVRRVGELGLGPGLEVVGFQSFRGWPQLSDEQVNLFRSLIDQTGLAPAAIGANADAGIRRDRLLTPDELVSYMEPQIVAARRLGFPVVRVQYSLTPDDMERLLPLAEREGVKLGLEIHAHHSPRHPIMVALRERYEKLGSAYLGFIPDWGSSMRTMPPSVLEAGRRRGLTERYIERIVQSWLAQHQRGPILDDSALPQMYQDVFRIVEEEGAGANGQPLARNSIGLFGHASPADWAIVAPWTVHMHGKFYDIDESGDEPAVPVRDILKVFVEAGYTGYISSEWEGWHWNLTSDPWDMVARHHALERRILAELLQGHAPANEASKA